MKKYDYEVHALIAMHNNGNTLRTTLKEHAELGYKFVNLFQPNNEFAYLIFEKEIEEDKQQSIEEQPQPFYSLDHVVTELCNIRDFCNTINNCGYYSSTGYAGQVLAWHIKQLKLELDAKNDTK